MRSDGSLNLLGNVLNLRMTVRFCSELIDKFFVAERREIKAFATYSLPLPLR